MATRSLRPVPIESTKHTGEIICPICGQTNWWHAYACDGCGYLEPAWNQAHTYHPWPLEPAYFDRSEVTERGNAPWKQAL